MNPYPFCSFCLLLRRWVLACSTYLLAIMTGHPNPGSTFYVHALCTAWLSLLAVLIATPEAALSLVQMIYCTGRIDDIKDNLVHYAYSEVSSLTKSFFTSVSRQIHVSIGLYRPYYIHKNRTWMSIHAKLQVYIQVYMQVYIIHVRFSLRSPISGNISSSVLTCSQTININYTQSSGAY